MPLLAVLDRRGFAVYLIGPRQAHRAPGRPKSALGDGPWRQRLHRYGLLTAAFRPDDQVVVLRGYRRQRLMLLDYGGPHRPHLPKALEPRNVQLTVVVSDSTAVTGLALIKASRRGERDPLQWAK